MKKIIITIIFTAIITSVLSLSFSYAATNYAISASKIGYSDNSNLGVDNVQAAIDSTCVKFSSQLVDLKKEVINEMYPKGSIYITTELKTADAVSERLGGTWEKYGAGKTLVSDDGTNYITNDTSKGSGGKTSSSTTLSTANLPNHTHDISHTHTTSTKSVNNWTASNTTSTWLVSETSDTTGTLYGGTNTTSTNHGLNGASAYGTGQYNFWYVLYTNTHSHAVSGTIPSLSTITQSVTTSGATGEGKPFTTSTMQPYIVVYMYKRTA